MLAHVEIITLYFFKLYILYEDKERPAQSKLMKAKLCTVLACAESTPQSVEYFYPLLNCLPYLPSILRFLQYYTVDPAVAHGSVREMLHLNHCCGSRSGS